jgi:mannosyltransferase OCH1-like enzyme
MIVRRRQAIRYTCVLIIIFILLIIHTILYTLRRRSPQQLMNLTDLSRYANATWPRRRIPRVIHQTYRTYDIPAIWNTSVQSVIQNNVGEFKYRRWSHADMDAFVQQHEPHFYWNTFINYRYDMQRIDSFRYVLMFHLGGIYIDMDNGCDRPFRELVATMEALDPDSPHLALFRVDEAFGIQTDFMISTAGHPIYRQFISRLHLFHHYFLIHHISILLSAGPLYATVQEHLFNQTDKQVVRLMDLEVYQSMFWKTKGGTWFGRDTQVILYLYYNRNRILWYCKISAIWFTVLITMILLCKQQQRYLPSGLISIRSNYYSLMKISRRQFIRLIDREDRLSEI